MARMKNARVLITGAARGLGLCTAEEFARAGCRLVITDIDEDALAKAKRKLQQHGGEVHARTVNVTQREEVEALATWVLETWGQLDILINNAGIGHMGELAETPLEKWAALMNVNFWGPLYHVYAFLPSMIEAKSGHIVNISSGQAFFRLPTWGAYATIKLALGAFSELLRFEVHKHRVAVTTVYPFMINTGFYDGIQGDTFFGRLSMKLVPYYSMSPEKVAKVIFRAVRKRKAVEMVTVINDVGYYSRLIPPASNTISAVTAFFLGKNAEESGRVSDSLETKEEQS